MNVGTISVRYARALFSLATEKTLVEEVYGDIQMLKTLFYEDKYFKMLLTSVALDTKDKKRIIAVSFKDKINTLTLNFLLHVVEKKREDLILRMIINFIDFYQEAHNIIPAKVISAVKLTEKQIKIIETGIAKYTGKNPNIELTVNPNLVGGFILIVKDMQIDMSVKSALKKFEKA